MTLGEDRFASDGRDRTQQRQRLNGSARRTDAVLLVANYESDVGYAWWLMENFWHVIAAAAAHDGRTCLLAYPRIGVVPETIRSSPLKVVEFRFSCRSWSDVWRGLALIRKHRIRSVYLTDWPYLHWGYLCWRLAGVRWIVLHDHTPGDRPAVAGMRGALKMGLHALRVFSATSYVAVSDYVGQRLQQNARVPASRCVVVTNGIRAFDCNGADRFAVRDRLGIPRESVLIVLVSRATYYKGLDFAVRCLSVVLQDESLRRRVYAVHCGDGPDLNAFGQTAEAAGIAENFRFLGLRRDVRDILCAADIAFHPSQGEAMSLAVLEFMCAGLAVLTSNRPSVCTAIDPGVSGITYEHGNVDDAVAKLRSLINDPALRLALGAGAAVSSRLRYTLETMNREFMEKVLPRLGICVTSQELAG